MKKSDPIASFFDGYPPAVSKLAGELRKMIRSTVTGASETLDESGRVVGYGIGPGYAGLVCTIIPSKSGVKLGVARSATLPDPHGLLEGTGKQHRYIQFQEPADLERKGIGELLRGAQSTARPQ